MANHRFRNDVRIPECLINDSPDASLRLLLSKQLSEAKEMEKRHNLERLATRTLSQAQKVKREMAAAKGFSACDSKGRLERIPKI
jgi:hypothetical protein